MSLTEAERRENLLDHLRTGVTTVCRCWSVERRDGVFFGFTDHDETVTFGGRDYAPNAGFDASVLSQTTGLSVDNSETVGILNDPSISEVDIEAGRYDGAEVDLWLVNWKKPHQERMRQFRGTIGEIKRDGAAFTAELRGPAEALNRPQGRVFQGTCSCIFGDSKCGIDLEGSGLTVEVDVSDVPSNSEIHFAGAVGPEDGWFDRGRLVVLSGAAKDLIGLVKRDIPNADGRALELWQELRAALLPGDRVRLEPGCDKTPDACIQKFSNFDNFRGFPHIPGEDWLTTYPQRLSDSEGASMNEPLA